MKQRGRILRDTSNGAGLLSVDGKQLPFELEGVWKASVAPKPNMVVEVEFNEAGDVVAIYAVDEAQLAREQAEAMLGNAKDVGIKAFNNLSESVGKPVLISIAALLVSWFFLAAVSIRLTPSVEQSVTFWDILKLVNAGEGLANFNGTSGGTGIYGFIAFAALVGPFYSRVISHPLAKLGGALPLALMSIVGLKIYFGIQKSTAAAGDLGGRMAADMMNAMMAEVMKALSVGFGTYIAIAASAYLALIAFRQYLAAKASV